MKTIKGLLAQPSLLDEEKGLNNGMPIFRILLKNSAGKGLAKSKDNAIELCDIAIKLKNLKEDSIELEDSDFKALKISVEENLTQNQVHVHRQMIAIFELADKESEEKKKAEKK